MRDPLEENEADLDQRGHDSDREQRWAAFVQIVTSFAETENWSGVMAAVARARYEYEHLEPSGVE